MLPGPGVVEPDAVMNWVARAAQTGLHHAAPPAWGGARQRRRSAGPAGARPSGLRVVDASVMPVLTNANTYAPVMAIAERAADLIAGTRRCPRPTWPAVRPGRR